LGIGVSPVSEKLMTIPHELAAKFDEVYELRASLDDETDRGCALMAAAYLDSELEGLLAKRFVNDDEVRAELMRPLGPLGSFSVRIDLAYALGLIGAKARRDLHLIRKIRNDFGHVAKKLTFSNQALVSRCKELYHDTLDENLLPRKKFTRVVMGLAAVIHAQRYKVKPTSVMTDLMIDESIKQIDRELLTAALEEMDDI